MRRLPALVATAALVAPGLAACRAIYGVDGPPADAARGPDASAVPDAVPAGPQVTGTYVLRYLDPLDAPVATAVLGSGVLEIIATLDDGTSPPVTYDATTGAFHFPLAHVGQAYRLRFADRGEIHDYELDAPTLKLEQPLVGHLAPGPVASSPTPISIGPLQSAQTYFAVTTGVWTDTLLLPTGSTAVLDWSAVQATSGVPALLSATAGDVLYVTGWSLATAPAGNTPTLYQHLNSAASAPLTLTDGQAVAVDPTFTSGALACVAIRQDQRVDAPRVLATFGALTADDEATLGYTGSAGTLAVPAPTLGLVATIPLSSASTSASSASAATDAQAVAQTQMYTNPFPIAAIDAVATIAFSREIGDQFVVVNRLAYTLPVAATGCPTAAAPTGGPVVTAIALAGTALGADGTVVSTRGDAVVTWTDATDTAAALAATTHLVTLARLVDGRRDPEPVAAIATTRAQVTLTADLLVPTQRYVIRVDALHERPDAAAGDWTTLTSPIVIGQTWSGEFTVAETTP